MKQRPRHHAALQQGFQRSGGFIGGDALALLMRSRCEQPISLLARQIVQRELIHFRTGCEVHLPLFQFDPCDLTVRHSVQAVIETLRPVLDDQELASWFADPNDWLGGQRPADVIASDPAAALEAARADRFVVAG
jgi:hypothetical protein